MHVVSINAIKVLFSFLRLQDIPLKFTIEIPISKYVKNRISVTCHIINKQNNYSANINMVVDTGATKSAISNYVATKLGYDPSQANRFEIVDTAGGEIEEIPVYRIDILRIATEQYDCIDLLCIKYLDDQFIDGVLGMDILTGYDIYISFTDQKIHLRKRPIKDYIHTP